MFYSPCVVEGGEMCIWLSEGSSFRSRDGVTTVGLNMFALLL